MNTRQRAYLRSLANSLKPIVTIGKEGLTDNVQSEIKMALYHNELVKVAALKSCAETVKVLIETISNTLECHPVQCVGNRLVVYKFSDKEGIRHIVLPD